jgi:predicted ATPase
MRSISFQDTQARSISKACSLKCFRERLTVMRGGRLTADPLRMQAMRQWSLRSWLKTAEVFSGPTCLGDSSLGSSLCRWWLCHGSFGNGFL